MRTSLLSNVLSLDLNVICFDLCPAGLSGLVDHGVHAIIVPLRDEAGRCLPGVEIHDCGCKVRGPASSTVTIVTSLSSLQSTGARLGPTYGMCAICARCTCGLVASGHYCFLLPQVGLNGVDNGAIRFSHVRVPRTNLLDRFASVDKSGRYSSPLASEVRVGDPVPWDRTCQYRLRCQRGACMS